MKRALILSGAIISIFLLIMIPNISAVEYQKIESSVINRIPIVKNSFINRIKSFDLSISELSNLIIILQILFVLYVILPIIGGVLVPIGWFIGLYFGFFHYNYYLYIIGIVILTIGTLCLEPLMIKFPELVIKINNFISDLIGHLRPTHSFTKNFC